jgi:hypothetical protein
MSKLLLALALIVAFSAPAVAAFGKAQSKSDQRRIESTLEGQWKVGNAQRRPDRQRVRDPYWMPCNNSSSNYADYCD